MAKKTLRKPTYFGKKKAKKNLSCWSKTGGCFERKGRYVVVSLSIKVATTSFKCLHRISKDIARIRQKNCKKRNRVAALCIGVGANGAVESVYKSFRSESLSQLWLHKLKLTKWYHDLDHASAIVGYDDGCHYHAYMTNPLRAQASVEAKLLAQQDVVIDNCHLRGHTDIRCKKKFNAKLQRQAKKFNTEVAQQTFS